MKLFKLSTFVAFIISTITATTSFAGREGGGGDVMKFNPPSVNQVQKVLENLQEPVTYALISFNNMSASNEIIDVVINKIYTPKNGKDIFWYVANSKVEIKTNGACQFQGLDKDASVNVETNTVCFSLNRMIPKLSSQKYFSEILAIAAHEYSHLMGTSENEANVLQAVIQGQVREDAVHYYSNLKPQLKRRIEKLMTDLMNLNQVAVTRDDARVGLQISLVINSSSELNREVQDAVSLGLEVVNSDVKSQIYGLMVRMPNLLSIGLLSKFQPDTKRIFGDRSSVSLTEYAYALGFTVGKFEGTVRKINLHDWKTFAAEVQEIQQTLNTVLAKIK